MKTILPLAIITILFISCTSSHSNDTETEINNTIKVESFDFDSSLSLSCNICLLKDSIDQIITTLVYANLYEDPIDSALINQNEELENILEKWKQEFKQNNKNTFDIENTAFERCKKEFTDTYKLNQTKRDEYLFKYVSYAYYSQIGEIDENVDTSQLKKIDGNYLLKFQGNTVLINTRKFPEYWKNGIIANTNIKNYIESIKNDCIQQIIGKQTSELSKIEMLMFLEQAKVVNVNSSGYLDSLLKDKIYQDLFHKWKKAWLNE